MENQCWPPIEKIKLVIEDGREFLEICLIDKDGVSQDLYDIDLWLVKTQEQADRWIEHLCKKRWFTQKAKEEVQRYFKEHLEKHADDNE